MDNYVDKNFNSRKSGEQYSYFEIIKILIKRSIKYIILSALYPIGVVARGEKNEERFLSEDKKNGNHGYLHSYNYYSDIGTYFGIYTAWYNERNYHSCNGSHWGNFTWVERGSRTGSMWKNTFMPTPTSFCFSPFAPAIAGYTGGIRSVIVCFVPRILVGIVAALVFRAIRKTGKVKIALLVSGAMAAVTNTILVMSGIYFLFGEHYASATGRELTQLPVVIVGIIGTQGVAEAIVSSILTLAVAGTLLKISEER